MKTARTLIICAAFGILWAGCGRGDDPAATPAAEPVTEITITGDDLMRFAPRRFTVRAGETITLTFDNIGRMPKESMGHNLAIIHKSQNANAFAAASIGHPANEYIAPSLEQYVIAATKVLGPGETEVIVFQAPTEPGEYPYVCSFPGHTPAGMVGIMEVIR